MNAPARLAAFAAAAVLALAGGAAVGSAVGPIDEPSPDPAHVTHEERTMTDAHVTHESTSTPAEARYRVVREELSPTAGVPSELTFRVVDPAGDTVTRFEERHDRPMHLIVVSADTTTYAHLHPTLAADGTWTVALPALEAGGYRLVADTVPSGGPELVLTSELVVPGTAEPRTLPEPSTSVAVDDLTVDIAVAPSERGLVVTLTVRSDGTAIRPDPYLGARGHLVAFSVDDLSYLHVHPDDGEDGTDVQFVVAGARPGRYRLFFDFSVAGTVRTAAFTFDVGDTSAGAHEHSDEDAHR